nr:hypothetical protein [Tanacetum cinerariifolium]
MLKDGVIAKLNSRVFKLEAIIKVFDRERKGVSFDKSCVSELFNNFSSGCWEELNEEFNELCETKFCVNGPTMIDLDSDEDLVKESRLKQEEEERCRLEEHKMMKALFIKTLQEEVQRRDEKKDAQLLLQDLIPSWYADGSLYKVSWCDVEEPRTDDRGCVYFMWMDDFRNRISSSRPSTPLTLYTRHSTRPSYSARTFGSAMNVEKDECSNCKFLAEKIKTLEAKIKILEGTLEMERHPKNYTIKSIVILHELYNDMEKLGLE